MNQRTIQEIEAEMEELSNTGNLGRMMDLVDEHGNTLDKMYGAIIKGDTRKIKTLESLGIDITEDCYVKAAIIHEQLLVVIYQINKGADVDLVIDFAAPREEPLISGNIYFSGSQVILQWAKCWQSAKVLSDKLPLKGQIEKISKI
jgi:hypothetical protein